MTPIDYRSLRPGHLIRRAQQIAVAIFMDECAGFDLTPVQYAALAAIAANRDIDATRLSYLVALDRSTIGTVLERLEAKGLRARLNHRLAPLPTVTSTAKPFATLSHDKLEGGEDIVDFNPRFKNSPQAANAQRLRDDMASRGIDLLGNEIRPAKQGSTGGWLETGKLDELGHKLGARLAAQIDTELEILLDQITGLPIWYDAPESYGDTDTMKDYPYQLIGHHTKTRTHSSYGNVDWMKSVAPQQCWINAQDAATIGIANGDDVVIATKRGKVQISAKVTERIMPGVVSLPQGAWYDPETRDAATIGDTSVLDRGGCISVLTSTRPTPISKGNGVHTNLCKIAKA